jgi:hypothetical protein
MMSTTFKSIVLLGVTLAMTACAHSIAVKCDGKLEPINLPEAKRADIKSTRPQAFPAPQAE